MLCYTSSAARNVRFNHISNTGFEVSWDLPVHSAFVKGYQLTIATQDGRTTVQKHFPKGETTYTHVVSCVLPGQMYSVSVETLYSFQQKGFYSVQETAEVSTPADNSVKECLGMLSQSACLFYGIYLSSRYSMQVHHHPHAVVGKGYELEHHVQFYKTGQSLSCG